MPQQGISARKHSRNLTMKNRAQPPEDLFQWSELQERPPSKTGVILPPEPETARSERFPRHPLSQAFGDLPSVVREELAEKVRQSGQVREIPLLDGQVLLDWEIYNIALDLSLPVQLMEFSGDDPLAFVIVNRLRHSQWNGGQRAVISVRLHAWRKRGRPEKSVCSTDLTPPETTNREESPKPTRTADMAAAAKVSATRITQAKRVESCGLSNEVISGDLKFAEAHRRAKLVMDVGMGNEVRNGQCIFKIAYRKAKAIADAGFTKRVRAGDLTCDEAYQLALAGETGDTKSARARPLTKAELVKRIRELERENRHLSSETARAAAAEARAVAAEAEVQRLAKAVRHSGLVA